jgi:hypothetical protein
MPPKNQQPPQAGDEWVRANTARTRFGISLNRLARLALAGEVRAITPPGTTPRYALADLERVASSNPA